MTSAPPDSHDCPPRGVPVLRFAPSPNGLLHLGHAYSALLNEKLARAWAGRFLLRIEDIDTVRCRPELEAAIYEDLAWLGLTWEVPVRRQSEHFADYRKAFGKLRMQGLVYPCFCSRREVMEAVAAHEEKSGAPAAHDPDGVPLYPGTCRTLPPDEAEKRIARGAPHVWRLDMHRAVAETGPVSWARFVPGGDCVRVAADPARWGDVVLVRRDTPTSYHLSVTVDDALQGVTHVVRGQDLEAATDIHRLLQSLLGLPAPDYFHHPLIRDEAGGKLAKSRLSQPLSALRAQGVTADEIRARLGFS